MALHEIEVHCVEVDELRFRLAARAGRELRRVKVRLGRGVGRELEGRGVDSGRRRHGHGPEGRPGLLGEEGLRGRHVRQVVRGWRGLGVELGRQVRLHGREGLVADVGVDVDGGLAEGGVEEARCVIGGGVDLAQLLHDTHALAEASGGAIPGLRGGRLHLEEVDDHGGEDDGDARRG